MVRGAQKTLFCYCHVGGELIVNADKSVSYKGGTVDGLVIDQDTKYDDFLAAVCEQLNITQTGRIFQYTLKFDKSCPLPLKNQSALNNLLNFNDDVGHVYVMEAKNVATVTVDGARCPSEYVPIAVQSAEAGCSSENILIAEQLVEAEHVNETVDQYDEAENVNETAIFTDGSRCGKIPAFSPNEWDEEIIGVGQQFQSGEAFRAALFKYAFAKRFNYKFIKNHNTQMSVVCATKGCCWKLTAHSWKGSGPLRVKQFVDSHKHSKQDDIDWKPALNAKMILELVGKKIASSPNYSAKEIRKDIESKYNLTLPYHMVWRSKEKARLAVYRKVEDSYTLIPHMCQRLINVMPGTVAACASIDGKFKQLFVSYNCSIHGFLHGCRPLLFIDDFELTKPSEGVLLSVTAVDANENAFPVAYGVIYFDDRPDYVWFFERVKSIIGDLDILIISDGKQRLLNGLHMVFGWENYSYCFRSVKEKFRSFIDQFHLSAEGKSSALALLDDIAYARAAATYNKALNTMCNSANKEMYDWVLANNPELWANSLCRKKRWDKMHSDLTEPFNAWVVKNCQVPVLEFMKAHQEMVAELLVSRKRDVAAWKGLVGDKIELKIKENLYKSQCVVTRRLSESMYEFRLESSVGVVDLSSRTCTCLEWQMIGIPCEHACGVMQEANLDVYSYVETWYHKEAQEAIYAEVMNALPPEDTASLDEVADSRCCAPLDASPACYSTKRKRIRRQPEPESMKRAFTCSDCNKKGHNRRSCEKRMKSWMLL